MKLRKNHRVIDIETRQIGKVLWTDRRGICVEFMLGVDPEEYKHVKYAKDAGRLARWYLRPPKPKRQTVVTVHPALPFGG